MFTGDCHGYYFEIDVDGGITHCESEGRKDASLGNVLTDSFDEIVRSVKLRSQWKEAQIQRNAMRSCPEFEVCRGWCPRQRLISNMYHGDHDNACCGLVKFIEHVRKRLASHPELVASYAEQGQSCSCPS